MNKHIPFILGFILLALAIWLQITSAPYFAHFIARLENIAYDLELRAQFLKAEEVTNSNVVIVDIDDNSMNKEGRWPWSRSKIARMVDQLRAAGAVIIAFDIMFPEKELNIAEKILQTLQKKQLTDNHVITVLKKILPAFDEDKLFADSLNQLDVVLGITFLPYTYSQGMLPPPVLQLSSAADKKLGFIDMPGYISNIASLQASAKGGGFINVFPDDDGVIRRVPVLIRHQNNLYPSLALEAVRVYLLRNITLVTAAYDEERRLEAIALGNHIIPTDSRAEVIVPFRGDSYSFPYYSATDVLNNRIPPNAFAGKIVFVGSTAIGLGDLKATAIQNIFPGVEVQATIADGILNNHFSFKPAWAKGAEISLTLFLGIIFIFLFPHAGPRLLTLCILLIPPLLIAANSFLWKKTGLLISVFIPMLFCVSLALINLIYGYLFETRKREKLKEIFGQYVPEKHIDAMLSRTGNYGLAGEAREMTVLFADIRNFTAMSEPMTAVQVKEMLNAFFTPMTEIIFKHHGTIDKYVGDMIMAFWGAPLKDKLHAQNAISAALDMQKAVKKLHSLFAEKGWPDIRMGIGLNTGLMNVGDMGSRFRRNYTVLGDAVNLGSRIESLTKYYGVKIIVTEFTRAQQRSFVFRKLDRVRVKGKRNSIEIYEVMGYAKTVTPELKNEIALHDSALEYYFAQQWEQAFALFTELQQAHPKTKLYRIYLERVATFIKNPPAKNWDGVFAHLGK